MAQIRFTASFQADLDDIAEHIAKDSPRYASRFVETVYERVEQLANFSKLGRVVPEYNDEYLREIIFGNYRIVYH